MRLLGAILLLCAGALGWLSIGDRMTPLALDLVELETTLGLPLYAPVGTLGALLLLAGFGARRPAALPSPPPTHAPAPAAPGAAAAVTEDDDAWVPAVIQKARSLTWEPGASLTLDAAEGVPFLLRLSGLPPAAEGRSLQALARFLSTIPTPPRVRVSFSGSSALSESHHHRVRNAMRAVTSPDRFQVLRQGDDVDVLFFHASPCWEKRGRLFIDG